MVFDTTATNSGNKNGACTIFEREFAKKKLLWLACRHHVGELILSATYKCLFGPTYSPTNDTFKLFRDVTWDLLNTNSTYKTLSITNRQLKRLQEEAITLYMSILTSEKQPRYDYRECAELMLILLGQKPPRGVHWIRPGAIHHARWMVTILYSAKMYAFSEQINLSKEDEAKYHRLNIFNALYYVPFWLTARRGEDAAVNDLQFWMRLYILEKHDPALSHVAKNVFANHLWYLTEELAPLSLFSGFVSQKEKQIIAKRILQQRTEELELGQPTMPVPHERVKIVDLIGPKSWTIFQYFQSEWLNKSVEDWQADDGYKSINNFAVSLNVCNDLAERGVKMTEDFIEAGITTKEDELQMLLQVVEDHRRKIPNLLKSTLKQL